ETLGAGRFSHLEPLPPPLDVDENLRDKRVSLALPLRAYGSVEVERQESERGVYRYRTQDAEIRDSVLDSDYVVTAEVGQLNARLVVAGDAVEEFTTIPMAHVVERRPDNEVVLDETFIPTVLRCDAAAQLRAFINELKGLLQQRADSLAGRVTASGEGGASEITDFLMLRVVNRYDPWLQHLSECPHIHPENYYVLLLQLAGELATLTSESRRPVAAQPYVHEDLARCIRPLMDILRAQFRVVRESPAIPIPLEPTSQHGIYVGQVHDASLLTNANFVLCVGASLPVEELRSSIPRRIKISAVEQIAELVNNNLPGIDLVPMPVAPRQIPYYAGNAYFELSRSGKLWEQLVRSAGIAVHAAGQFPDLKLRLWAIRSQGR
ncbi:MAG: type VI secretion system baseplate subunit TssK, partial [Salinisphaera sp.]|nr:type VI secretion system baseplate subunit TssK [Salinisphaera sp.]